jgi:hypothetical protein
LQTGDTQSARRQYSPGHTASRAISKVKPDLLRSRAGKAAHDLVQIAAPWRIER